ncbi:MAG: hypothetical protein GY838_02150 [bacterium]|nr:hypothetical protein [bacterium]
MQVFELIIGKLLPYATLVILIVGLLYRLNRWQRAAVGNIALYPSAATRWRLFGKVLSEVTLFSSFRQENQALWKRTWPFHVSLFLILLGHTRLITDWPLRVGLGLSEGTVNAISAWGGGICGVVALMTCLLLLARRFGIQRVREISTGEDYGVLILLLFILLTGNAMRFFTHYDIAEIQQYFRTLFSTAPTQVPHDPLVLLHFLMVQLLLIYFPFGKFLHVPGVFYSKTLLAKDY